MPHKYKQPRRPPSDFAKQLRQELMGEPLLNVTDVAHILDRDESTVLRYIRTGHLVAVKRGREYEVLPGDLRAFVQRDRDQQREEARRAWAIREVEEQYAALRSTPTAQWWARTNCWYCGTPMLIEANTGHNPETWTWLGDCLACGKQTFRTFDAMRSIADADAAKAVAAPNAAEEAQEDIPF